MKKFLMTIVAAVAAVSVNAQVYVGGGLGFTSTSHDGESVTNFAIIPEVGYTLDENMALGLAFGYAETGNDNSKVKTLAVNPYLRYNVLKFGRANLFLDGGFAFKNTDSKSAGYKTNEFAIGIKPGLSVSLNEKLSFVSHLGFVGYETSKPDYDGAKSTNTFGLDLNSLNLTFGMYYNF